MNTTRRGRRYEIQVFHRLQRRSELEKLVGKLNSMRTPHRFLAQTCHGPDITISLLNPTEHLTIEVKVARNISKNCWRTNPVKPKRLKDDFIVIAIPVSDKRTLYRYSTMKEHLALCDSFGHRVINLKD